MSLVSINDVLKITTKVEKIHPYKVFGDRDSYSPYNEGWNDCVSLIESYLERLPSAEPEMLTIEEVSNQLGCATIQSALYWFEFLKTLDLLGFAIVRKETR